MYHLDTVNTGKLLNDLIPPRIEIKLGKLYCNGCKNITRYTKLVNDTYKQFIIELNDNLLNTDARESRLNYLCRTLIRFKNCKYGAGLWYETVINGTGTDDSAYVFKGEHTIFGQPAIINTIKENHREFTKLQAMFRIAFETIELSIMDIEKAIIIEEKEPVSSNTPGGLITKPSHPIFKWKGKPSRFAGIMIELQERGELEYLGSNVKLAEGVLALFEFEKGTTPANLAKELSRTSNSMSAESTRKMKEEIDEFLKNSRN